MQLVFFRAPSSGLPTTAADCALAAPEARSPNTAAVAIPTLTDIRFSRPNGISTPLEYCTAGEFITADMTARLASQTLEKKAVESLDETGRIVGLTPFSKQCLIVQEPDEVRESLGDAIAHLLTIRSHDLSARRI